MEVKQIYELVNDSTKEILGETALLKEDLSNIVDIGTALFNANAVDSYVKKLINHIGRVVFVNRVYDGNFAKVRMDSWEFGSVLEKITMDLPEATESETWQLEDKTSYDPNIFYKPTISVKFYNSKTTFEVPISFTEKQVKQSFSNATQLNSFLSMIFNAVQKSMTIKEEALIRKVIANFIGETLYDEHDDGDYTTSGVKAINLLAEYNDKFGKGLTLENALTDKDFLKYASYRINLVVGRMKSMSSLYNIGRKDRFTPADMLHVILLNDFVDATTSYLEADTFHKELVSLKGYEKTPYWQGTGTDYELSSVSKIDIKTASGHDVSIDGVVGVAFDRDALGVTNLEKRTTSNWNPKAEFYTNWAKFEAGFFNDFNENFVVFYLK